MSEESYSKQERRELRRLSREAHEMELNQSLEALFREFQRWNEGELPAGDLSDAIHSFDRGPSTKLFKLYNGVDEALLVARGIALGLLAEEDVSQPLSQKLEPLIRSVRAESTEDDE